MKMMALAVMISASATLAAMPQTPSPSMQKPTPTPVSVQGCVDRAMPDAPLMYMLIDAQAGGASPVVPAGRGGTPAPPPPKAPITVEPRYWLTGATSTIDFSKHQNQRVEVVGLVMNAPAMKPGAKPLPPDAPKATLQVSSIKMLSTECK
ncbi:MAG TPA: hypothetical protein VFV98_12265 [Vicinamibacterales bacterium]|nr:hypothetical protein [Vicinamibacterales bacterium]